MVVSDGHELKLRLLHILRRGLGLSCHRWSPGPSVANYVAMDGPPGPSTAAIDIPPGLSEAP